MLESVPTHNKYENRKINSQIEVILKVGQYAQATCKGYQPLTVKLMYYLARCHGHS